MGIQFPSALVALDNETGGYLTNSPEDTLAGMGRSWLKFAGGDMDAPIGTANDHAGRVFANQHGPAVQAFQHAYQGENSPQLNLRHGATGGLIIGLGLLILAGIVLVLKVVRSTQLVQLALQIAQALAEAFATAGASTALIPVYRQICSMLGNMVANQALNGVMGGGHSTTTV